jgi:NADH-quinone oxidoreductase subunit A
MPVLVFFLVVFLAIATFFLFFHLAAIGKPARPDRPDAEKLTIYECGEPTVGSAWIQFDLRYYVVALLFVVFDVEVAFFFPWAVVFGTLTTLAGEPDAAERARIVKEHQLLDYRLPPLPLPGEKPADTAARVKSETITQEAAKSWAMVAFLDIFVFFGVLMVGFAYLWRRGDIDWVRTITHSAPAQPAPEMPPVREQAERADAETMASKA